MHNIKKYCLHKERNTTTCNFMVSKRRHREQLLNWQIVVQQNFLLILG